MARTTEQRVQDSTAKLEAGGDAWLATSGPAGLNRHGFPGGFVGPNSGCCARRAARSSGESAREAHLNIGS